MGDNPACIERHITNLTMVMYTSSFQRITDLAEKLFLKDTMVVDFLEVYDSILSTIGNTPLVRITRMAKDLDPTILAKVEFFNPGGSVKDRIGVAMIEDAEKKGLLHPGDTIVEPTSGNTGIGLALAAIVKGYKMIVTIPDKMSDEKISLLRSLCAQVIITPTDVEPDDPESYVKVAERIAKDNPRTYMPNQYYNMANPMIHYRTTGPEIWKQTDGKIDVFVAGVGTGGTITGTGRYLKEMNPDVKVIGVDPEGSMYYHEFNGTTGSIHSYLTEGIGEDFMPDTLDMGVIDEIVSVSDKEALLTARRLVREEGIMAGGSSGAAVFAALKVSEQLDQDKMLVVLLPDTSRNYLSKIFSNEWMKEHEFISDDEEECIV